MVEEGEMPLPSYLIVHRNARLTPDQKDLLLVAAVGGLSSSVSLFTSTAFCLLDPDVSLVIADNSVRH